MDLRRAYFAGSFVALAAVFSCDSADDADDTQTEATEESGSSEPCEIGTAPCGGICVSVEVDPSNCGGCDLACAPFERCAQGTCVPACGVDEEPCDADCVPVGECGLACDLDEELCLDECVPAGTCGQQSCVANQVLCDGQCRALSSTESCGSCDTVCAVGQPCRSGPEGYRCVPRNCAGVRDQLRLSDQPVVDGEYEIDVDGDNALRPLTVYCADLNTDAPLEYLNVDPAKNYSTQKFIYANHENGCGPCDRRVVHWERVRLLVDESAGEASFAVDVNDKRFTTHEGFNRAHEADAACANTEQPACDLIELRWAHTFSCNRTDPRSEGLYNIGGTGLRFPADILDRAVVDGWMPEALEATIDPTRHQLRLRFEATCGNYQIANPKGEPQGVVFLEPDGLRLE